VLGPKVPEANEAIDRAAIEATFPRDETVKPPP